MKFRANINMHKQQHKQRLITIKIWQQRKVASELTILKLQKISSTDLKRSQQRRRLLHAKEKRLFLRNGEKQDYEHSGRFQDAVRPILVMAQIAGIMPLCGVTLTSANDLNFSWRNLRTYYSLFLIGCFGFCSALTIAHAFRGSFTFDTVETIIFYTSIFVIACGFFNVSRKWPALLRLWQDIEHKLPALRTQKEKSMLAYRIKMIAIVTTMCSLSEHLLSMLSIIYYVNACPVMPNRPIESFLFTSFSQYFYFFSYNNVAGILGKVVNVLSTCAWNYNDIFVMSVSVGLTAKFKQLNDFMQRSVGRPTTAEFWIRNRVNYRNLCKLCLAVDDTISFITLLCFANNLYFICNKILKSIQKKPSFTHTVYFWFSLLYLLMRTFSLLLYTAAINEETKRPLLIFRSVRREYWCPELKRFSEEVTTDVVALSGMKFFHLTRGVVLSVAGTIVTYELILLQFNKADKINDCFE